MSVVNPFTLDLNKQIQTGNANSILTRIFIEMLRAMNVDSIMYENRIDSYIVNAGLPKNLKELSSVRGNIKKELSKPSMSWKIFLKSMVFLGVREFTISLTYNNAIVKEIETTRQNYIFDYKTINIKLFGGTDKDKNENVDNTVLHDLYKKMWDSFITKGASEQELILNYINKAYISLENKDVSSIKGSMKKEMSRENMTWKVFVKGLCFLGIEHYILTLELIRTDKRYFKVSFPVNMSGLDLK